MGKGGYHGGSTIIGPGSGWFGTGEPAGRKTKKKKAPSTSARTNHTSALQAARNAAAAARKDADLAAAIARRAAVSAEAAERVAIEKAEKVRRMEVGPPPPSVAKTQPKIAKPASPRKITPKQKKKPTKTSESEADRLARANYKKNEAATHRAIEVLRVRGRDVVTHRKGLDSRDVPVKPARKEP